jgi:hypothetical protein
MAGATVPDECVGRVMTRSYKLLPSKLPADLRGGPSIRSRGAHPCMTVIAMTATA